MDGSWRIIPVSKWLVTPISYPKKGHLEGEQPQFGDLPTMVISNLLNVMIVQLWVMKRSGNVSSPPLPLDPLLDQLAGWTKCPAPMAISRPRCKNSTWPGQKGSDYYIWWMDYWMDHWILVGPYYYYDYILSMSSNDPTHILSHRYFS